MAAIELYSKGTNYLQLRVTGLSGTYGYKRTYAWYIATSGSYKPNSPAASGTDSSTNAEQSPVATLSGLNAFTYYYVWCEIYLQGQSSPTTTLEWSGYTAAESKIDVYIKNFLDTSKALVDGKVSGISGDTFLISAAGTQYQTYSQQYQFQFFRLASESYSAEHAANYAIPITAGQQVRAYYKTKETAVAPYISGVTLTKNTATVTWNKNGGTYGNWTLYYGKSSTASIGAVSVSDSPSTISGLNPGTTYYFWIINSSGGGSEKSNVVSGSTKAEVAYFAWTSNDAAYIAAGKAVTNLTAASWNRLTAKINEVRAARGYGAVSFTPAYAGRAITAAIYNEAANAIASLPGAGSVSTVSAGTAIEAAYFANSDSALKEALNRAISSYNG